MELFQIFWDDQKNLFLEFKKNEDEKLLFLPERIKRLTLQFEITRVFKQELYHKQPPYLISIKKLYHAAETLSFSIELDEISNINELQIKILRLTIFLYPGQRIEYIISESYKMAEIEMNEDCYLGYQYEELISRKNSIKEKITQEKIFQEVSTNFIENKEKRTIIYEKSKYEGIAKEDPLLMMISESNETLKSIEQELKNLSLSLRQLPISTITYNPSSQLRRCQDIAIEKIKSYVTPTIIQGQIPSNKLMVIKEMKSIFKQNIEKNSTFNVKEILNPMTEDELKAIMLNDDELSIKENEAINNQKKRLERKQEKQIQLENLKKPE